MQTVSNKSFYLILFCNVNYVFFCKKKYQIVNSLRYFLIQYLFKFSITVFKMLLDSGRFPREHAKYTVVLENTAGCQQTFCW